MTTLNESLIDESAHQEPGSPGVSDPAPGGRRRRPLGRVGSVLREAVASAVAAPVGSILTIVMIAGMCAAVLLTSGRTVGAEQAVIGSIDSAGTRSIIVRAEASAGLDTSVLDRVANFDGIEWAAGFGLATDVQNTAFPGGTRVPLRVGYGQDWDALSLPRPLPGDGDIAYGSESALEQLGMTDPIGGVQTADGTGYAVGGRATVPDHLGFLEPLLIAPQPAPSAGAAAPIGILVIVAERPDLVAPLADAVTGVLAVADPTKATVETSEDLATLRALIEGQLGAFGRTLTLGILALTALLAAAILYGIVMMRRKDYGRRRALGASQHLIVALLLIQTGLLAAIGAAVGTFTALIILGLSGDPLPGTVYILGVAILAVVVGLLASLVPALVAARREPITELRVP